MDISIHKSKTVNFADVAHNTLIFDKLDPVESLVLELIDTAWVQRLRRISQTGNTKLVYMFAEHSRFGHCLGAAYLACMLLKHLSHQQKEEVEKYSLAVAAAAILHDVGHLAPGSHLAEHVWAQGSQIAKHEALTQKIVLFDPEISQILAARSPSLPQLVADILGEAAYLPSWVTSLISGGGWNVDRGNWSIVDSVMCAVTYGRYNVTALIDAFRLTDQGQMVIQESRLDALTHFFVARNSMYRQVYQHRVLQTCDAMTRTLVRIIREKKPCDLWKDTIMEKMLFSEDYQNNVSLEELFLIDESWWLYHLSHWCSSKDKDIADFSRRLRDRKIFKTISLDLDQGGDLTTNARQVVNDSERICAEYGYLPKYYSLLIKEKDKHLGKPETPPRVLRETGEIVDIKDIEPLTAYLSEKSKSSRAWLAVPKEIKEKLGKYR